MSFICYSYVIAELPPCELSTAARLYHQPTPN